MKGFKNIADFKIAKEEKRKISMVSCYDYSQAKLVHNSHVDTILVGDSVAMVVHGHPSTVHADLPMMVLHTLAVRRGTDKFIVADLPFLSYRRGIEQAMEAVDQLMKAGANAVKLEGVRGHEKIVQHIVESGIPVMGHLGFTPQSVHQLGGFKVQGKDLLKRKEMVEDALVLQELGAFALVLECVPHDLAKEISEKLEIATIGIGAGANTDGQVLVYHDLLGMDGSFSPKFLRKFMDGYELTLKSLNQYHQAVQNRDFPSLSESYGVSREKNLSQQNNLLQAFIH